MKPANRKIAQRGPGAPRNSFAGVRVSLLAAGIVLSTMLFAPAAEDVAAATKPAAPPVAAPRGAPPPAPAKPAGPILRFGLEQARVGDRVEYRVGLPPSPGVESRAAYRIGYEIRGVRTHEVTLVRTTRTLEGRELAREVFTVKRYPRLAAAPAQRDLKSPPAGSTAATANSMAIQADTAEFPLAGRSIECRRVQDTVRENGLLKALEWGLSTEIPITALVYEKVNGAYSLELLDFARGGEAANASEKPAAAQTPAEPVVPIVPIVPAAPVAEPVTLPPESVTPLIHIPGQIDGEFPLEDEPAPAAGAP